MFNMQKKKKKAVPESHSSSGAMELKSECQNVTQLQTTSTEPKLSILDTRNACETDRVCISTFGVHLCDTRVLIIQLPWLC